ncbi:hypothetical protein SteCoe_28425 [Stentor coeruleus]|uniref:Uncharacterized protein n=1 Tax=Stentor coeruleus TaxID=5963 RepID=A0A1R2B889_9CILI|nr:hypothetical protein SteCoe_28425 [Stentor coeruleus]
MKINSTDNPDTVLPRFVKTDKFVFYEIPGFSQIKNNPASLINACLIKYIVENSSSARIVFIISQDELSAEKGKNLKETCNIVKRLFPNNNLEKSSALILSKSEPRKIKQKFLSFLQSKADQNILEPWVNIGKLFKMSHPEDNKIDTQDKLEILQGISSISPQNINSVTIDFLYNIPQMLIRDLFEQELTSISKCLIDKKLLESIDIKDKKTYFDNQIRDEILSLIEQTPILSIIKPASINIFTNFIAEWNIQIFPNIINPILNQINNDIEQMEIMKKKIEEEKPENVVEKQIIDSEEKQENIIENYIIDYEEKKYVEKNTQDCEKLEENIQIISQTVEIMVNSPEEKMEKNRNEYEERIINERKEIEEENKRKLKELEEKHEMEKKILEEQKDREKQELEAKMEKFRREMEEQKAREREELEEKLKKHKQELEMIKEKEEKEKKDLEETLEKQRIEFEKSKQTVSEENKISVESPTSIIISEKSKKKQFENLANLIKTHANLFEKFPDQLLGRDFLIKSIYYEIFLFLSNDLEGEDRVAEAQLQCKDRNIFIIIQEKKGNLLLNKKFSEYLFVTSNYRLNGDRIVEANKDKNPRSYFDILMTDRGYLIKNKKLNEFLFVSGDYWGGDQVLESKSAIEERSFFEIIEFRSS